MPINRFGEFGPIPHRTDRIYCSNGDWYFVIRRGIDQGPYDTREQAEAALKLYVQDQLAFEDSLRVACG